MKSLKLLMPPRGIGIYNLEKISCYNNIKIEKDKVFEKINHHRSIIWKIVWKNEDMKKFGENP